MSLQWSEAVVEATIHALTPLADPVRAAGARRYMKDVAPFLGVATPERRIALRKAWSNLPTPSGDEIANAAIGLMALREREFHYAAYDLISVHLKHLDKTFLPRFGAELLTTTPWWDTVDGLVTAMVSPLCKRFGHESLINDWSESGNRWLIRAALGHQRGWRMETEFDRICSIADSHWDDPEFFVAKAIGWALRDCARLNPERIEAFMATRTTRNTVAEREIRKGLATAPQRQGVPRP